MKHMRSLVQGSGPAKEYEMAWRLVVSTCEDGDCPKAYTNDDGDYAVQGAMLPRNDFPGLPEHEAVVESPREFWAALRAKERRLIAPHELDGYFDHFQSTAFRLETLDTYTV